MLRKAMILATVLAIVVGTVSHADPFTHEKPGHLQSGSGSGVADDKIYLPGILFPIEKTPAFANSQVYGHGGMNGPGGGQCDKANYSYPWRDTFCEKRSRSTPMCPGGTGHQGQDIRPASCQAARYWTAAVEDGVITNIGTYSVSLLGDSGTLYRYLHLQMNDLNVGELQRVTKGEHIGKVSNNFGGTPTTIHLHFEGKRTVTINGKSLNTFVPPYSSLVAAYEKMSGIQ
ncbi:M23 family metallopeptidase [Mesorhizobium sp. L103C105A0]|uniref:M23 family metallopeptidase n=1 Tax=Mesorhizobium sp. L103C105A0 TaxID=1287074 RepID=UPI0003CFC9CF|nr:M23 family metallopeptidase [Mesorhizobium sp. L103C105A0]ESZ78376.1 peptidase M24 [Mesorhizobium sp. L103C105A0]